MSSADRQTPPAASVDENPAVLTLRRELERIQHQVANAESKVGRAEAAATEAAADVKMWKDTLHKFENQRAAIKNAIEALGGDPYA